MGDVSSFKGSAVHVFKKHLDLTAVIEHVMTLDYVEIIDVTQDLDFATDLAAHVVFVVTVDYFEGERSAGRAVEYFIDGSAATAADSVHTVEFRYVEGLLYGVGDELGGC